MGDLMTDMQEVKHYYTLGVLSRNGIDHWKPRLTAVHTNEIKIFYPIYCLIKNYNLFSHRHSFIHHFVLYWMKKGIRWKSGTIPVAVFPPFKEKFIVRLPLVRMLGRHDKRDKSEDLLWWGTDLHLRDSDGSQVEWQGHSVLIYRFRFFPLA